MVGILEDKNRIFTNLYGLQDFRLEAAKRRDVSDLWNVYVRNAKRTMVPLQSIASLRTVTGP